MGYPIASTLEAILREPGVPQVDGERPELHPEEHDGGELESAGDSCGAPIHLRGIVGTRHGEGPPRHALIAILNICGPMVWDTLAVPDQGCILQVDSKGRNGSSQVVGQWDERTIPTCDAMTPKSPGWNPSTKYSSIQSFVQ